MVDYTANHELQLWEQQEEPWEHRSDLGKIDTALPITDVEANLNQYEPKSGAQFHAEDTDAMYRGDGSNWNYVVSEPVQNHLVDTSNPHGVTAGQVGAPTEAAFDGHVLDTSNPHEVTAGQVGAPTAGELDTHVGDTSNPHGVTAAQVGALTDLDVLDSGASVASVSGVDFGGNLSVTDNTDGTVTVNAAAGDGTSAVTSVFSRTGDVVAQSGDYTAAQVTGAASETYVQDNFVEGNYEIQKDGTDGTGIINFKTV